MENLLMHFLAIYDGVRKSTLCMNLKEATLFYKIPLFAMTSVIG